MFEVYKTEIIGVIIISIFVSFLGTVYYYKSEVSDRDTIIKAEREDLLQREKEEAVCKNMLDSQTQQITAVQVDLDKKTKEFNAWKNQPESVKYKTIYKLTEVKSDDCNDTKNLINSIRTVDYNSL